MRFYTKLTAVWVIAIWCIVLWPQSVQPPVTLKLTTEEQLRADNLQLEDQLLTAQIELSRIRFTNKLNDYVTKTLAAHGSPKNVVFDPSTFKFVLQDKGGKK